MCTRTEDVSFVGLIAKFGVSLHLFVRSLRAFVASWIMQATGRNMQYEENVAIGWAPIRWPTWSLTEYKLNVKLLSIYQLNLHTRAMQSWSAGARAPHHAYGNLWCSFWLCIMSCIRVFSRFQSTFHRMTWWNWRWTMPRECAFAVPRTVEMDISYIAGL